VLFIDKFFTVHTDTISKLVNYSKIILKLIGFRAIFSLPEYNSLLKLASLASHSYSTLH